MALPKGFRNNIRLTSPNIGVPRRQELLDNIADDGTFLPRGVHYKDIDETFIEFVNKELNIEIDGQQVPVIFLTIQRYSEFTKTWKFTDEYKNIKIPFITIVRKPDVQVGTNYNGLYNIPGRPTFTYYKVPTNDGARVGIDLYKVPQPTSVDISYEVRLFTNKMSDLNLLNSKIQKKFQSRQAYVWPKGHPMPVMLESIGDESNIDDFENRRFYVQPFEMLLAGYILDEDDFEVVPTINRAMVMSEIELADGVTTPITDPKKGGGCVVATEGSVIVRNTDNTVLSVVSCGENYVVGNSLIFNSGSTYSQLVPATTNFELPNITHIDSNGQLVTLPAQTPFTATTCEPAIIINSGATYSASTPAGSVFELPNDSIVFKNLTGGTIETEVFPVYSNPSFTATSYCNPVNIINSGLTFAQSFSAGTTYELPNITHTDSDGSPVTLPAQTSFNATPCNNATIDIGLFSDSGFTTPITGISFNNTVYISADTTNITPTSYRFEFIDSSSGITNVYEGASNTTSWVANESIGVGRVFGFATDDDIDWIGQQSNLEIEPVNYLDLTSVEPVYAVSVARYLKSTFVGNNVVEVRRSSDNQQLDFTIDEITDGTLTTWVGGGNDGFVVTLYDHSGNGNDRNIPNAAAQFYLVSGGTLLTDTNGNPKMRTTSGSQVPFGNTAFNLSGSSGSYSMVSQRFRGSSFSRYWGTIRMGIATNMAISGYALRGDSAGTSTANTDVGSPIWWSDNINQGVFNGGDVFSELGDSEKISEVTDINFSANASWLTNYSEFVVAIDSEMSEWVLWGDDISADRETLNINTNQFYQYY